MIAFSRRQILTVSAAAGGGMLVGVKLLQGMPTATADPPAPELTAWIRIGRDDIVTIAPPHMEIGQAVATSQTQLIAEELDADWNKIVIRTPEADQKYGFQFAGGSQTIALTWIPLRQAGAAARAMLMEAASKRWKVPAGECTTESGFVLHAASGRKLSYGAVASEAAKLPVPSNVTLKPRQAWRFIGKPIRKLETPAIVIGKQIYGMDFKLPGMLVASLERLPTRGAKPRYDPAEAMKIEGVVKIVELAAIAPTGYGAGDAANAPTRGGVAVVAHDTWTAFRGREGLAIQWDEPNATESSGTLAQSLTDAMAAGGKSFYEKGDLGTALKSPGLITVEAEYDQPFLAHMMMEPQTCVAQVENGRVRCWGPTQDPQAAAAAVADALKISVGKVLFETMPAGGGFGRRNINAAVEAALVAAQMDGVPVKMVWKREDETLFDQYRPVSRSRVRIAASKTGDLIGWDHHLASPWDVSERTTDTTTLGKDFLYEVPNASFRHTTIATGIELGAMRGVNSTYNVFATESAIDELAHALGQDPFALRLKWLTQHAGLEKVAPPPSGTEGVIEPTNISYPRMIAVMKACAKAIGWNHRPGPGRGMGLVTYNHLGTHMAVAAEAGLTAAGKLKLHRIVAAADVGSIVNPLGVEAQIQGGLIFGLSGALRERITIAASKAEQTTYSDYPVITMTDVPAITVVLVDSSAAPTGCGEAGVPGAAPAVANAIFAATGKRIRALPLFHAMPE